MTLTENFSPTQRTITFSFILLMSLMTQSPRVMAQSGGWDAITTNGNTGNIDHGNGVIQFLDSNQTGCASTAAHRLNDYNLNDGAYSGCFQVFFGCPGGDQIGADSKGDGMAMSFWTGTVAEYNMNAGGCGGGLGYNGARPKMITVEFDTYSSRGESNYDVNYEGTGNEDQAAIQVDGNAMSTSKLVGANPGNLEDGGEHEICVTYDPTTGLMNVTLDGGSLLTYNFAGTAYDFATYFDSDDINITWSSGKFGATNPTTVTDGADISKNIGSLCSDPLADLEASTTTFCPNEEIHLSAFPQVASYEYHWFLNGNEIGPATIGDTIKDVSTPGTYTVNIDNGTGEATSNAIALTQIPATTVANAGADQTINAGATANLTGNEVGNNETGTWTGGLGSFSNVNDPQAIYTPHASETAGTVDLTWTIDNGECPPTTATTTVTILDPITPTIVASALTFCPNESIQLEAFPQDNGYTYEWFLDGTSLGAPVAGAIELTASIAGNYTVEINNGSVIGVSEITSITEIPATTIAAAGDDQIINENESATMTANAVDNSETGTWSGGLGTFNNLNDPLATYTPHASETATTVELTWTIDNGQCPTTANAVSITILDPITPTIVPSATEFCPGESVQLDAFPQDNAFIYEWFVDGNSMGPATAGLMTMTITEAGDFTVVIDNGSVIGTSAMSTISQIANTTIADAGDAQGVNENTAASLAANSAAAGETGRWTGGLGTFSDENDPQATYTHHESEVGAGPIALTWTIDNGRCPSNEDQVVITIIPDPVTPTIVPSALNFCPGESVQLAAYPQDPTFSYEWLLDGQSIAAATIGNLEITATQSGAYTVVIDNGLVTGESPEVSINEIPATTTANAGDDQGIMQSEVVSLAANAPGAAETGTWTGGLGTFSNTTSATSFYTPTYEEVEAGATTLTWTIDNAQCPSNSDEIRITITPDPINPTIKASALTFCPGDSVSLTVAPQSAEINYQWFVDGVSIGGPTPSATTIWVIAPGDYTVTIDNGLTTGTSAITTLRLDANTTVANAGEDRTINSTEIATLVANYPMNTETGNWSGGMGTFTVDRNDPVPFYAPTLAERETGSVSLTWTIENDVCPGNSDQVTVFINPDTIQIVWIDTIWTEVAVLDTLYTTVLVHDSLVIDVVMTESNTYTIEAVESNHTVLGQNPAATNVAIYDTAFFVVQLSDTVWSFVELFDTTYTFSPPPCTPYSQLNAGDNPEAMDICPCEIYVPNSFTPNGDGKNDEFTAVGERGMIYTLRVFNRWGDLLFEADDINTKWDGQYRSEMSPPDVYVVQVACAEEGNYLGTVTLLR